MPLSTPEVTWTEPVIDEAGEVDRIDINIHIVALDGQLVCPAGHVFPEVRTWSVLSRSRTRIRVRTYAQAASSDIFPVRPSE